MNIGIVGNGVVGSATGNALTSHVAEVRYWDVTPERRTHGLDDVMACDMILLCLPTPQRRESLECDTSAITMFLEFLAPAYHQKTFVIRSTVPVGFTAKTAADFRLPNLIHWPEFLSERTAEFDAANPNRVVIGGPLCGGRAALYHLASTVWPDVPIFTMASDESELVKLMQNAFSAVKISFFNEVRHFVDRRGMDWGAVMSALLAGGWINPMHTQVPGPDGKFGFGGKCLPKDLANLICCMGLGDASAVCLTALARNKIDRNRS